MTQDLNNLVVEVLHNRGDDNHPDWSVGSGFFVGTGLVLTALHNVDGPGEVLVRVHRTEERPAVVRLQGDKDLVDLAVLEVSDAAVDIPPLRYGAVDRSAPAQVERCWAVGFPRFKERAHDPKPLRLSAQVDGEIPTGENLDQPLLTLLVKRSPGPPLSRTVRESEWAGMSGATVFSGNNVVVGVITEHHLPEGESALTVVPITAIDLLPEAEARKWWKLLGVDHQALMRLPGKTPSSLSPVSQNRTRLLKRVWATWIEGVLEHSLYPATWIVPDLQEQPDAVDNPWQREVQETKLPPRPLPAGTSIVQVYDKADGELLILGEPGVGKTTLLLHLTSELLKRAEQESAFPMPVVFTLSSWAEKRLSLPDWLIEELFTKYQVPRKLGRSWIEHDQLLLLLDGLDEVTQVHRSACLQAINAYSQAHNLVPIVLCSRKVEYEAQSMRVALSKAVVIQPLTSQQIDDYLAQAGQQPEAVRSLLKAQGLQELARTPLMLSILARIYQGEAIDDLITHMPPNVDMQRRHVLETYVECMLQRRAVSHYTPGQTKYWLAWLARQMVQHDQAEFYLERMQPDWLEAHQSLRRSYRAAVRVSIGLVGGLGAWLISGLTIGVLSPVLLLLYSELLPSGGQAVSRVPLMRLVWGSFLIGAIGGIIGLLGGGIIGFLHRVKRAIKPAEEIAWSWRSVWRSLVQSESLRNGLLVGLVIGLFGLFTVGLDFGLLIGLLAGLLSMSVNEAMSEFLGETLEKQPHTMPNHKRRCPARNRILVGLVAGLITGLFTGLVFGLLIGPLAEPPTLYGKLITGLLGKLFTGLVFGLITGLPAGLLIGLLTALTSQVETEKKSVEMFTWLWVGIWRRLAKSEALRNGLVFGLLAGVFMMSEGGLSEGLPVSLFFGLSFGLLYELTNRLAAGLSSDMLQERNFTRPNQGIHNSVRHSISVGLAGGLFTELLIGSFTGLVFGLYTSGKLFAGLAMGLLFGVTAGVMSGTSLWLSHGGIASVQHVVLRLFLWRARRMPWNYVYFLDYAAERILLHKVGGGYRFIHQLFLEYFASLNATLPSRQVGELAQASHSQTCECEDQDDRIGA